MLSSIATIASVAALVNAAAIERRQGPQGGSFIIRNPPNRGWLSGEGGTAPCGNVNTPQPNPYPMSIGDISVLFQRDVEDFTLTWAFTNQSTDINAFKPLIPPTLFHFSGTMCSNAPDFADLGLAPGDAITISGTATGGPRKSSSYSCADIVLAPYHQYASAQREEIPCTNEVKSTQLRSDGTTLADLMALSTDDQPISPVGAGFLGAGLTLAVAALALGLLFFLGFRAIRKNKTAAASTTGSTGNMVQNDDRSSMTTSMRKA